MATRRAEFHRLRQVVLDVEHDPRATAQQRAEAWSALENFAVGKPKTASPTRITYKQAVDAAPELIPKAFGQPTVEGVLLQHPWTSANIPDIPGWVAQQRAMSPEGFDLRGEVLRALNWLHNRTVHWGRKGARQYLSNWLDKSRERWRGPVIGAAAPPHRVASDGKTPATRGWFRWDDAAPEDRRIPVEQPDGTWRDGYGRQRTAPGGYRRRNGGVR